MVVIGRQYLPVVAAVAVVGDHLLRLLSSDGTAGDVDFSTEHRTGVLCFRPIPAYADAAMSCVTAHFARRLRGADHSSHRPSPGLTSSPVTSATSA